MSPLFQFYDFRKVPTGPHDVQLQILIAWLQLLSANYLSDAGGAFRPGPATTDDHHLARQSQE
jgi:hypothetical protein